MEIQKSPLKKLANLLDLSPAEKFYALHLKNVSNYQKKYPEKCREKNKRYFDNVKEKSPEKYKEMLNRKRDYYLNVIKPKKDLQKEERNKILNLEMFEN